MPTQSLCNVSALESAHAEASSLAKVHNTDEYQRVIEYLATCVSNHSHGPQENLTPRTAGT